MNYFDITNTTRLNHTSFMVKFIMAKLLTFFIQNSYNKPVKKTQALALKLSNSLCLKSNKTSNKKTY